MLRMKSDDDIRIHASIRNHFIVITRISAYMGLAITERSYVPKLTALGYQ